MTRKCRTRGVLILIIAVSFAVGCAPKISKKDLAAMRERSRPQMRGTDFTAGLAALRRVINEGIGQTTYFQVNGIANATDSSSLPGDVSEMVVTSVNSLRGEFVRVVGYYPTYLPVYDPGFAPIYKDQLEALTPQIPDITVTGAVTEFDEDITKKNSSWDIEVYWDFVYEDEDVDIDASAEFDKSEKISRVTLDLRLMDYRTHVFKEVQVSNTILVFELERERNLGFMIYGNGLSRTGKITVAQGLHQALRNLIDYSVLQLFGMYYTIPFWHAVGEGAPEHSQEWLAKWRRDFLKNLDRQEQIGQIQHWLLKYQAVPVYVDGVLAYELPTSEYGHFGRITQAFALRNLYQYAPESEVIARVEQDDFPTDAGQLADLYRALIEHIPIAPDHDDQTE